ncbi:MAG: DUF4401 domain-containing protein [Planctomycetes bacterium]|nr:DUF4401 domain-containing protein [Planctomycetota bacterium]
MSRQSEQMWATLLQAGLVQGPAPETPKLESPWFVKVLLAFSGWFAAVFMLGFIAMAFEDIIDSSTFCFITGGVMIGGAFAILRRENNEFLEHLALAVSLAGQALITYAIFDLIGYNDEMAWVGLALLQVLLAMLMPNFVHRVLSSFIAAFSFSMALTAIGAPYVFSSVIMFLASWLWLNEFRYPKYMRGIRAIGYGLVLALIQIKGTALFGSDMGMLWADRQSWVQPWMGEVLAGAVTLYVFWQLLRRRGQAITGRLAITALLGTLLLCAVSMEARGITVGMVIILLGFAGGNRVLLGLGIMSLLFYISSYYYLLDATLLAKALTLLIVGLVLLTVRWFMLRMMPEDKEAKHA